MIYCANQKWLYFEVFFYAKHELISSAAIASVFHNLSYKAFSFQILTTVWERAIVAAL